MCVHDNDVTGSERILPERPRQCAIPHLLVWHIIVVGVGVGKRSIGGQQTDELALVVMVSEKLPEVQLDKNDLIPRQLDGIPVDVREIGKLEAH